jgi:hypothetical protein
MFIRIYGIASVAFCGIAAVAWLTMSAAAASGQTDYLVDSPLGGGSNGTISVFAGSVLPDPGVPGQAMVATLEEDYFFEDAIDARVEDPSENAGYSWHWRILDGERWNSQPDANGQNALGSITGPMETNYIAYSNRPGTTLPAVPATIAEWLEGEGANLTLNPVPITADWYQVFIHVSATDTAYFYRPLPTVVTVIGVTLTVGAP